MVRMVSPNQVKPFLLVFSTKKMQNFGFSCLNVELSVPTNETSNMIPSLFELNSRSEEEMEQSNQILPINSLDGSTSSLTKHRGKDDQFQKNPHICKQATEHYYYYFLQRAKRTKGLRRRHIFFGYDYNVLKTPLS